VLVPELALLAVALVLVLVQQVLQVLDRMCPCWLYVLSLLLS
jgi:hypothetical protein